MRLWGWLGESEIHRGGLLGRAGWNSDPAIGPRQNFFPFREVSALLLKPLN